MRVRLYAGCQKLVEKSGVGQALRHQAAMLTSAGVEVTRRDCPDAAFVHINTVFPDAFAAALLAKRRGRRVICYGHSTMEDFRDSFCFSNALAPLFKRWIMRCYSVGDAIITPTEYARTLLLGYGIRKPIYVLSNGVDTDFFRFDAARRAAFRAKYGLRPGERAVLSVGHYIAHKGILEYMELARALPQTRFFWFGCTNLQLVPRAVRRAMASAPANLTFPGYVPREALRDAYCGCDLFCFLSREETEGIVVLEALASEIPVLVRDIPVYSGWLHDGTDVYKGHDLCSFRRQAEAILSGRAQDLTAAGRRVAEQRSIPAMGRQLLQIYREIAGADVFCGR